MHDYLNLFRALIETYMEAEIAATAGASTDYSELDVEYKLVYEMEGFDPYAMNKTWLIFNMLPYTPKVVDVGYYAVRRDIPVEVAVKGIDHAFVLWLLDRLEHILIVDERGQQPFGNDAYGDPKIDIIQLGEIAWGYEERSKMYFPVYRFALIKYYDQIR